MKKILLAALLIGASASAAAEQALHVEAAYLCKMDNKQTFGLTVYNNDTVSIQTPYLNMKRNLIINNYDENGIYSDVTDARGYHLAKITFREDTASIVFTPGASGDCKSIL